MTAAREALFEFEAKVDAYIESLDLWSMPLRSVYSHFFLTVDNAFVGQRFTRKSKPAPSVAEALIGRASGLMPFFLKCTDELGENLRNALEVFDAKAHLQLRDCFSYAHFCTLMPEVRRKLYAVKETQNGFELEFDSQDAETAETQDIVLSELEMSGARGTSIDWRLHTFHQSRFGVTNADIAFLNLTLRNSWTRYYEILHDPEYIPDAEFKRAFKFERSDFRKVRAFLFAFADACLSFATAKEARSAKAMTQADKDAFAYDCLEWAMPCLSQNFVLGAARGITDLPDDTIDEVVRYFSINKSRSDEYVGGDGFFPPIVIVGDAFLFSPHALKAMMPERNLYYVLNKRDPDCFNSIVGSSLEIAQLQSAVASLKRVKSWECQTNLRWSSGEVDILVWDSVHNVLLQIQAKAPLPPQGARMADQVAKHTSSAISQINAALKVPSELTALAKASFGSFPGTEKICSMIFSRSCFGLNRDWSTSPHIQRATQPVLDAAVTQLLKNSDNPSLFDLGRTCDELIHNFTRRCTDGWKIGSIPLYGKEVRLPLLQMNHSEILAIRAEIGVG